MRLLPSLIALGYALLPIVSHAEFSLTTLDPYQQTFDTLPATAVNTTFTWTNDSTLPGWSAAPGSGSLNTTAVVTAGGSNPAALTLYSVGTAAVAERALAYHTQVAATPTYVGLGFTNNTGGGITGFSLSYTPEQWRENTNARTITVSVQYRIGATSADLPATTGWTSIPNLEFSTLNGSATATATLTANNIAATVPAGATLWIRWQFANSATSATSSHDLLAIDNVSVSFAGGGGGPSNVAPSFTTQPASQTVTEGASVTFTSVASGTPAPTYQWFKGVTAVSGATYAALTITAAALTDAGSYTVTATNAAGSATSDAAVLTVNAAPPVPVPPTITSSPASRTVPPGSGTTFTVGVSGTAPLTYAWSKDGSTIAGATGASFTIPVVSPGDAGSYVATVTNAYGSAASTPAVLSVSAALPPSAFSVAGFGRNTTGGGEIAETNAAYRKVTTPAEFRAALSSATTKVIEIMNDLNLGWNELPLSEQTGRFRVNITPKLHPVLLTTGVSLVDIQDFDNLTIFSANGATIRHAEFNVKRCTNLMIRNLRFDELWEWDEATKGDYDSNDWDFITVDMASSNVWIDHCDFAKAYDGVVDVKSGSNNVTLSWCRFLEDDGGPSSWVRQQFNALESNKTAYAMYNFLRTNGFSLEDIIAITRSQKKGHLVGANDFDADNALLSVTLHHNIYAGMQDRLPRMRGGNAHVFNIWVDNRNAYAASLVYDARVAAMTPTNATKLSNGTYKFGVTQNGSISTESGSVLLEKSWYEGVRYALRNNQTDVLNPAYTGRVRGEDVIFKFGAIDFRGGSDTPGHPLGPTQAPELLPFVWSGIPSLPYSYATDDPADLPTLLPRGAGAGVVQWQKANWLRATYPAGDAAPSIVTQPASASVNTGQPATFTVLASGTPAPGVQWYKESLPISGATTASYTIPAASAGDAGNYTVALTNTYGSITSATATLTVTTPPAGYTGWLATAGLTGAAAGSDDDGDGVPLLLEYALGLNPTAADATPTARPALVPTDNSGATIFRFTKPKSATGILCTVETATSLTGSWTTATAPTLESQTDTTETYTVSLPAPTGALYARLKVVETP